MVNNCGSVRRKVREPAGAPDGVDTNSPVSLVNELLPYPPGNLTGGIVWADVPADITADEEEARPLRDAA
jgi:hypothetical protein